MTTLNTSKLILDYNPLTTGVAETAVRSLLGFRPPAHLRLVKENGAKFVSVDQQLRGNVRDGELFGFTFSGWVRTLVTSVAETENTMTNLINKSGPELVVIYNTVAKLIGEKDVTRFATKSAAVDRTARALAKLNAKNNSLYEQTCVALGLKDAPAAKAEVKVETAKILVAEVLSKGPVKAFPLSVAKAAPKATLADGIDAVEDKAHKAALKELAAKAPVEAAPKAAKPVAAASASATGKAAPGRPRDFNFKPFSVRREPRAGSYLAEALVRLTAGCRYEDMVTLINELDEKRGRGTLAKGSASVDRRAYELIRDLHFLNGYGIKHDLSTGLIRAYTA